MTSSLPPPARTAAGGRSFRIIGVVLLALLGFALAVSVRTNRGPAGLATARQEDLVRILDDLDSRAGRLRSQVSDLQQSRDRLTGAQGNQAALDESRQRAAQLGVLAGTLPAQGPGIVLTIDDPRQQVRADVLVDTIQELRDAGAEVIDLSGVRLGVDSYVVDRGSGLQVDGKTLTTPYRFTALGDPATMAQALKIPGGIVDSVAERPGAKASITSSTHLEVRSLRPLPTHKYARSAPS
ncbi:MAG TPA: DUF881 domain-containing protein [Frankiaceae bacterium]|nr:DUF881 domain-containing protein [Frankiaceae bacterium]